MAQRQSWNNEQRRHWIVCISGSDFIYKEIVCLPLTCSEKNANNVKGQCDQTVKSNENHYHVTIIPHFIDIIVGQIKQNRSD